uniref:Uncharacterized protein n=1 Tax=viral metagenome TaxID=1070528 RepID=A0A6C0C3Z6_9ZZZZ
MEKQVFIVIAYILLVYLLIILSSLILFGLFVCVGYGIKELIKTCNGLCCIICISKKVNKQKMNKNIELV